jgi:phosphoserine phosphatase
MKLALFDLDHTLLNTDSDHSWGEFLVNEGLVDPVRHRAMNDKFYEDYKAGQLDPIAYNEFVFEFLTQHDNTYLIELHELFMHKVIRPQMRPKVLLLLKNTAMLDMLWLALPQPLILLPHRFSVSLGLVKLLRPMLKWLRVNTRAK